MRRKDSSGKGQSALSCQECLRCVLACPVGIDIPALLGRGYPGSVPEKGRSGQPIDCIECGACSMRCPQGFPLRELVRSCAMEQVTVDAG